MSEIAIPDVALALSVSLYAFLGSVGTLIQRSRGRSMDEPSANDEPEDILRYYSGW